MPVDTWHGGSTGIQAREDLRVVSQPPPPPKRFSRGQSAQVGGSRSQSKARGKRLGLDKGPKECSCQ